MVPQPERTKTTAGAEPRIAETAEAQKADEAEQADLAAGLLHRNGAEEPDHPRQTQQSKQADPSNIVHEGYAGIPRRVPQASISEHFQLT